MATFTGDDSPNIFTGGADADTAYGNGGADQLSGNGHNDILYGGAGADVLDGGADDDILISFDASNVYYSYSEMVSLDVGTEHDVLVGGAGNDRLVAGYGDDVSGGTGENNLYINFLGATSGVYADFRAQLMGGSIVVGGGTITGITSTVNIQGSNYDDTLYSVGQYSFSNVYGNGGNDHIVGDYYSWILSGGEGNDVVDGRLSQYLHDVDGGAGDDILYGAYGSSDAHGGEGNDTIYAYGFTYGGAGNDLIVLQQGASSGVVYGEEGDDDISAAQFYGAMLAGGAGADVLRGNSGNDKLVSGGFRPNAYYVPADDMGLEVDTLTGGEGDDTLAIGYGDNADGGFGSDTLWLSLGGLGAGAVFSTAGIVSGQPFVLGGGTIQNVETLTYLRGTNFNDNLTIATQVTLLTIDSGEGDDVVTSASSSVALSGGNGNDRFNSGIAGDTFDGGAGSDTAAYGSAAAGITITLAPDGQTTAGPGGDQLINVENIEGSDYADSITGNAIANALGGGGGDDTLTGLAGNDLLDGGTGADLLRGGADNDIYVVDNAADVVEENSGEGTDEVRTSLASASLASYANVENLTGTSATGQSLTGNAGNNVITGGGGNDFLWLLAGGNDTAIGGLGNDVFLFGATMDGLDA
ncbi:MAG TPA: calcium-binding protein, partial [Allosphingosinicella sp.]